MSRILFGLLLPLALTATFTGCAQGVERLQSAATDRVQSTLGALFLRQFTTGIDTLIGGLAREGGYLDNPLVRILLPPPLGLTLDVARDLHRDPKGLLLETVINRAAENAIPAAGPVLKSVLANMTPEQRQAIITGDPHAATALLKETAADAVRQALLPTITESLEAEAAMEMYGELLERQESVLAVIDESQALQDAVSQDALPDYVAQRATDGLFILLAEREAALRDSLSQLDRGRPQP